MDALAVKKSIALSLLENYAPDYSRNYQQAQDWGDNSDNTINLIMEASNRFTLDMEGAV